MSRQPTGGARDGAAPRAEHLVTTASPTAFTVVSPAGPVAQGLLELGLAALDDLDVPYRWDASTVLDRAGFLAGADVDRAQRLGEALDARPRGLWMSRGGYGSIRTLAALGDRLDGAPPVPLWGFSDGTALLGAWVARGWPAWYAPPISQLPRLDELSHARLRAAVHADHVAPFDNLEPLVAGQAEGPLAGGNLCVAASLVGTPWALDFTGRVALFEDTGEAAYRVDRLLTQLRHAGALAGAVGLVFGDFTGVRPAEHEGIAAVLRDHARHLGVPAARGLPVGHDVRNAPVPLGAGGGFSARLDVGEGGARLSFRRS